MPTKQKPATQAPAPVSVAPATDPPAGPEATFAPRPKLTMLPTERVEPSPLNPRKSFDPEKLEELAASVRAHGIQQPIVVRQTVTDGSHTTGDPGGHVSYQIVMGERRWRAAKLAGLGNVPCLVRADLDDRTHALLAMEENEKRSDLSPIERARGYRQCLTLGVTQAQIGETAGVGQSRISNLIRLLELPADVQEMVGDGRLTAAHGTALLSKKYAGHAALIAASARHFGGSGVSVAEVEKGPPHTVVQEMIRQGGARDLEFPRPLFDRAVCKKCPLGALVRDSWGNDVCLNPGHFDELQAEATARQQQSARGAVRAQAEAQGVVLAPDAEASPLPLVKDIPDCMIVRDGDAGDLCSAACPCRVTALSAGGEVLTVCTDRHRCKGLVEQHRADVQQARRAVQEPRARAAAASFPRWHFADDPDTPWSRALAWQAVMAIGNQKPELVRASADRLGLRLDVATLKDSVWNSKARRPALEMLSALRPSELIRLMTQVRVEDDAKWGIESGRPTEFLDWFLAGTDPDVPQFPGKIDTDAPEPISALCASPDPDAPASPDPDAPASPDPVDMGAAPQAGLPAVADVPGDDVQQPLRAPDPPLCASCGTSVAGAGGRFCDWCDVTNITPGGKLWMRTEKTGRRVRELDFAEGEVQA